MAGGVHNVPIINNQSVSGTNSYVGNLNMNLAQHMAIQSFWTGTPSGSLIYSGSNDNINWTKIGNTVTLSGSSGNNIQNFPNIPYVYVQASYTNSTGTGVLTVNVASKKFGD